MKKLNSTVNGTTPFRQEFRCLFCGEPLVSYQAVVNLISHTNTKTGLKVKAWLDSSTYEVGKKVSDEEMERIKIKRHEFHGEWNYTIFSNK